MKSGSAAALVAAVIALSACGADSSSTSSVVLTTATPSQGVESEPSSKPDNFVAKTVSGETFVLSNALAQKPVVLWFWAPG
jgi:ABC-type glycerol-3-phosphate transport system substrate-binding protein